MKDMEAKDLRLGNLVNNERGEVIRIVPSFIVDIHYRKLIGAPEIFKPIELTEEWLIKLGGQKIGNKIHFGYGLSCLIDEDGDCRVFIKKADFTMDNIWLNTLKFVHQFQNLYFSYVGVELLTGTEI